MYRNSCLVFLASTLCHGVTGFILPQQLPIPRSIINAPRDSLMMMAGSATLDNLPRVVLKHQETGHEATVHLHGGCVTSYKAPHEVLAVRKDAAFDGSKPIAGGLQICFPQFGAGQIQQHGFARNLPWEVAEHSSSSPEVTLLLKTSDATKKIWDESFELYLHVALQRDCLLTRLTAKNTGSKPWDFTAALHSYYALSDISNGVISGAGLQGATYIDKTKDPHTTTSISSSEVVIDKFLEGVLPNLKGPMALADKGRRTRTSIEHSNGWKDYILWAPVGNEQMGYKRFVCVESGAVSSPVTVAPGAEWVGEMKIYSKQT